MFKCERLSVIVSAVYLAITGATPVIAGNTNFDNFQPLRGSVAAGSLPENAPFQLSSPSFSQSRIADRGTQLDFGQSNPGSWDMITANETGASAGRYLLMPFETSAAGVQRIDLMTGLTRTIVQPGTQGFAFGDASRWTPWGDYLTAEESWDKGGTKGRLFELTNPVTATGAGDSNFVYRSIIPRVSHEGLAFDKDNNLYFVDEFNGGGIYRYVPGHPAATSGNDYFSTGQTFAMRVGGDGNSAAVGSFTWAPITNSTGGAIAGVSVLNKDGTIDGRSTATIVGATGYQRPEDMEIKTLANGDQIVFVATTTTDEVYSINLASHEVKLFASHNTIDESTGLPVGNALTGPDNVAIDTSGNIYIVEDQPGGMDDIWLARDVNNDGVAESLARWASLSTIGSEPTGLYFDKFKINAAYVNVQHPDSLIDSTIMISAIPEPRALSTLLAGLGCMAIIMRRRHTRGNS